MIINNNNQQANNQNYIGTNEAVKMIDAKREVPLLESADQQEALGAQYLDGTQPQIIATRQRGFKKELKAIDIKKPKRKEPLKKSSHIDRREDDGEIVEFEDMD